MSSTLQQPIVRAYLDELRGLLAGAADRDLIVDGVARHIEDAVADAPDQPERIRAVLDDLGDPAVIAADAAADRPAPTAPEPFLRRPAAAWLTVALLAVGGFVVPLLGWVAGVVLLWSSRTWTVVDKLVGTFLAPLLLAVVVLVGGWIGAAADAAAAPCTGATSCGPLLPSFPGHLVLLVGLPVLQALVGVVLVARFRRLG